MKILVLSLAGIGDTLMATPLIHELRANFPDATLDALVMWPGSADLLAGNPHLNQVRQKNLITAGAPASLKFLSSLRKHKYDLSLNTHPQSRASYRMAARVVGARIRVSHRYDQSGALDRLLVNRSIPQDYSIHCLENNLALLPLCGAKTLLPAHPYELFLTPAELDWAAQFAARPELASRVRLGIHVGSGGTKNLALRRWPLDHYIALINQLNQLRPDIAVLLFGGPEEEESHARILAATAPRGVTVPHTAGLRQAAALIGKSDIFLSVDTALMHLAAAMKVPRQIVIETPTFNKTVEPWGQRFITVKNPAVAGRNLDYYRYDGAGIRGTPEELLRAMASVSVDDVFHAITGEN
jgi:ADP-heptose:LPS heptosyltransferase